MLSESFHCCVLRSARRASTDATSAHLLLFIAEDREALSGSSLLLAVELSSRASRLLLLPIRLMNIVTLLPILVVGCNDSNTAPLAIFSFVSPFVCY